MQTVPAAADPTRTDDHVTQLWDEFAARLRRFISTKVSNQADADDILQDVFVKIQRSGAQLRDADRMTTWIFRIANNAIIDHYRSAPRRREVPVEDLPVDHHAPPADAGIEDPASVRAELAGCLRPLLGQLAPHYREALELVELDGVSQTAAAGQLGLSVSGMKSRVQRARAQVFDRLNEWCSLTLDPRGGPVECVPGEGGPCG